MSTVNPANQKPALRPAGTRFSPAEYLSFLVTTTSSSWTGQRKLGGAYIRAGALVNWIRWRRLSGCNALCVEWRRGREYIPMHFIAFRMHLAAFR